MTGQEFYESLLSAIRGHEPSTKGPGKAGAAVGGFVGAQGSVGDKVKAGIEEAKKPPLSPGELAKEYFNPGGSLRVVTVWVVIILVGLIGIWGLIAPGGGVAVVERFRRK